MKYTTPKWLKALLVVAVVALMASQPVMAKKNQKDKKCPFCKTTGRIANPFYEKYAKRLNLDEIEFSSWVIETDTKGHGLPWYPCERCRNQTLKAEAEKEFNRLVNQKLKWVESRRKIDEELEATEPLLHLETEHFKWVWTIPELTYKKRKYRSHEALHLYAMRMEAFYDEFLRVHRITEKDLSPTKHFLLCFEREIIAKRACPLYGKQASPSGRVTLQGVPSVCVKWMDPMRIPTEEYFYRDLIHSVTHLLVAVYHQPWWLFESGFAYEGLAHWWEIYYTDMATSTCMREIDSMRNWVAAKWEQKVKKAVLANKCPSIVSLLGINGGSLPAREHIFSWSIMDYMMFLDPKKTLDFCLELKKNKPAREAFYNVWGTSILNFDMQWKEYVKKEYKLLKKGPVITKRMRAKLRGSVAVDEEKEED